MWCGRCSWADFLLFVATQAHPSSSAISAANVATSRVHEPCSESADARTLGTREILALARRSMERVRAANELDVPRAPWLLWICEYRHCHSVVRGPWQNVGPVYTRSSSGGDSESGEELPPEAKRPLRSARGHSGPSE